MRMKLHTCYNIKTEDEPVEVKPTPLDYDDEHDELEDFFQAFEEEVRLLEKEKEGRMIESDVIEDKTDDAKDINLIKEIDILEKEKEEALKLGWLLDNENMEVLTLEEMEDEMIDMLVWASGEHYMKEERKKMPDKDNGIAITAKKIVVATPTGGAAAPVVEEKKEEAKEESDNDTGFSLFD
ncbi:hypothetical protein LWI29_017987 [Acer saccharum]|uniref:Uncharacterized protein n=1 Tax=Acer saccharum TaxID=4024 RepID=A0AA39VIL1_ACESA|nr:hypothetical protein LWI29_017987 [Acer saccharum]